MEDMEKLIKELNKGGGLVSKDLQKNKELA